jgi:uncharacterized protein YjbJ (UPF0337 family)
MTLATQPKLVRAKTRTAQLDSFQGKWKQRVGTAQVAWGKWVNSRPLQIHGYENTIEGLAQQLRARPHADQR